MRLSAFPRSVPERIPSETATRLPAEYLRSDDRWNLLTLLGSDRAIPFEPGKASTSVTVLVPIRWANGVHKKQERPTRKGYTGLTWSNPYPYLASPMPSIDPSLTPYRGSRAHLTRNQAFTFFLQNLDMIIFSPHPLVNMSPLIEMADLLSTWLRDSSILEIVSLKNTLWG